MRLQNLGWVVGAWSLQAGKVQAYHSQLPCLDLLTLGDGELTAFLAAL